jgi:hypothetical protein
MTNDEFLSKLKKLKYINGIKPKTGSLGIIFVTKDWVYNYSSFAKPPGYTLFYIHGKVFTTLPDEDIINILERETINKTEFLQKVEEIHLYTIMVNM